MAIKTAIELTAVDTKLETQWTRTQEAARQAARGDTASFREVDIEEDDMERPITAAADDDDDAEPTASATSSAEEPAGLYFSYVVFASDLRGFHPRKGGRKGTRLVFMNGAAQPVKETYAEVKAKFGIV